MTPVWEGDQFKPKTMSYAKVAHMYEKYQNNNSTFNNKSLSDNRNITDFYKCKERGIDYVQP